MRCYCCNVEDANYDNLSDKHYCSACRVYTKLNLQALEKGGFTLGDLFRIVIGDDAVVPECGRKVGTGGSSDG